MKRGPENNLDREGERATRPRLISPSNQMEQKDVTSLFVQDTLVYMAGWLSYKDFLCFSASCREAASLTQAERNRRAASALLEFVVKGNEKQAERILRSNPDLILNDEQTTIDHSGKTIKELTAFQAALCAGDVEMCEMMKQCFDTVENGFESLKQQYDKLFPQGIEAYSKVQKKEVFNFSTIITAISNAPNDEVRAALDKQYDESKPLHKALSDFKAAFDKLSFETQIFNPWHLHKAFTLYKEIFGNRDTEKADLFWEQVVGQTMRHLPACGLQAFELGLFFLNNGKKLTAFNFGGRHDFCPPDELCARTRRNGFIMLETRWRGGRDGDEYDIDKEYPGPDFEWKSYCEQKHQAFSALFSRWWNPSFSCTIS